MSVLKLAVTSGRPTSYLTSNFETPGGNHSIARRILNYIESLQSGSELAAGAGAPPSIGVVVQENEVQASGTFVFDTVIATDAFSINGVSFTCMASGATGNQFNVGADDLETAENAAAAINASVTALVAGYVTAEAFDDDGDITLLVTSSFYGLAGNQTLIASADSTIVASGATLTGGADDATAQTLNF